MTETMETSVFQWSMLCSFMFWRLQVQIFGSSHLPPKPKVLSELKVELQVSCVMINKTANNLILLEINVNKNNIFI